MILVIQANATVNGGLRDNGAMTNGVLSNSIQPSDTHAVRIADKLHNETKPAEAIVTSSTDSLVTNTTSRYHIIFMCFTPLNAVHSPPPWQRNDELYYTVF